MGLGNPGPQYSQNRHNIGFQVVDHICSILHVSFKRPLFSQYLIGRGKYQDQTVYLVKPLTFMNRSGEVLNPLFSKTGLNASRLLVICDTLDLSTGECRFKMKGSPGGHNGLASILRCAGTENIMRLVVGIGRPEKREEVISYVLGNPDEVENEKLQQAIKRASLAVLDLLTMPPGRVMNAVNRKNQMS
ncbi:MAG: aminoacyl-tRNA hydrolase [Spirochaetota bacterium]